MKKLVLSITLIIQFIPLYSSRTNDSLQVFLKCVGEDSIIISNILNAKEPSLVISMYLSNYRLQYDSCENDLVWMCEQKDSSFIHNCNKCLTKRIYSDTALNWIDPYLIGSYLTSYKTKDEKLILNCAEYAVEHFYSRAALLIPELYYYNHQDIDGWEIRYNQNLMQQYILLGKSKSLRFIGDTTLLNTSLNGILKSTDNSYSYYSSFRKSIDSLTDMELACLTIEKKTEMVELVKKGLYNDDKATVTYAFMLITGTFAQQDISKGYQILESFLDGKIIDMAKTIEINGNPQPELDYQCGSVMLDYVDVLNSHDILYPAIDQNRKIYGNEREVFFFHGDHLGSANWITDYTGKPVQYLHYAPYGELIANQQLIRYDERYKFTGKERDTETGYDYLIARYYSSLLGHFTSPDPLADKYPNISPYAYCNWNPVKYIDPDGRWVHIAVGALIGATINGAYAIYNGKSWSEVGAATLGGAVSGGIVAATAGLGTGIALSASLGVTGGAIGGAVGNLTEQSVNVISGNQQNIDVNEIEISAMVGGVTEGVGGLCNGIVGNVATKISNTISKSTASQEVRNSIRKEVKNEFKISGNKISNRKIDKITQERIADIQEFNQKTIQGSKEIITNGVNPIITNCVENEYK